MSTQAKSITAGEDRRRKAGLKSKLKDLTGPSYRREELQIDSEVADRLDFVKSSVDRETAVEQVNQRTQTIHNIESALERIQTHTYGRCARCNQPISGKRLRAVPWAGLCAACQSVEEAARQVREHIPERTR